ncbi:hypothetical protein QQX98_005632 [Neonectria punicea]|uniref:Xylanolytic transcriptional activator regulatory domain-containing protein n=1 Tax=Neonectria punicea TaxID=979145 RepID=A0ABR1H3L6_9HYPO
MADIHSGSNEGRFEGIEDRLKAIEAQLWRNATTNQSAMETDYDDQYVEASAEAHSPTPSSIDTPASLQQSMTLQSLESTHTDEMPLPPRHEIEPLVANYFQGFNQAMPLFHHENFMKMVQDWYHFPSRRDQASWSAINVVIALSLRHTPSGKTNAGDSMASTCIRNAQSTMDSLVYRDQDLKGLQVLLGLALLFLGTAHPHPACVLVATAVKLAHRLKLHIKEESDAHENTRERNRLFWITYIVDRTISMHTVEPYLLQYHDMDIDVKGVTGLDDVGFVFLNDSSQRVDFFQLRIELAIIQGKVYDLVYSVRASKLSSNQKQAATERLDRMLDQWYRSVPEYFTFGKAAELEARLRRHCISLHVAYYQCLFSSRRANASERPWVKRLIDYSDTLGQESEPSKESQHASALLPSNWSNLVTAARSCLALSDLIDDNDSALRWSATCAYQAAVTILAAKNLTLHEHDLHELIDSDQDRIETSVRQLELRLQDSEDPYLRAVHSVCSNLSQRAAVVVSSFDKGSTGGAFWDDEPSIS